MLIESLVLVAGIGIGSLVGRYSTAKKLAAMDRTLSAVVNVVVNADEETKRKLLTAASQPDIKTLTSDQLKNFRKQLRSLPMGADAEVLRRAIQEVPNYKEFEKLLDCCASNSHHSLRQVWIMQRGPG